MSFYYALPLTLLFWAEVYGLFGVLVVLGGKIMARIGPKHTMLISHFFFCGYYLLPVYFIFCRSPKLALFLLQLHPWALFLWLKTNYLN
ncbi:MAG: hypothetical protein LR000_01280 [Candidatus Pacebacteria bacterium]|nr:hypothetical protein [Candidatus Paceibacterota bacterium]